MRIAAHRDFEMDEYRAASDGQIRVLCQEDWHVPGFELACQHFRPLSGMAPLAEVLVRARSAPPGTQTEGLRGTRGSGGTRGKEFLGTGVPELLAITR